MLIHAGWLGATLRGDGSALCAGQLAFRGVLRNDAGLGVSSTNNEVLLTDRNGPLEAIAREGDPAPCIDTPGE